MLALGFVPVAAMAVLSDGFQEFSIRAHFLDHGQVVEADPHVVVRIDGHAMGLASVTDHVFANGADELMVWPVLIQLRRAGGTAFEGPEIAF